MKKHIVVAFASLVIADSLTASEGFKKDHCFRAAFQKKLKRVKSVGFGSFKMSGRPEVFRGSLKRNLLQKEEKKPVFIDWRKLYWGKLTDLIYGPEELCDDALQTLGGEEEQDSGLLDSQETESFARELRQELKAFARQYGLKIVWRKKSPDTTDGTAAFLEYWDRGLSQENQDKVMPFAELCVLTVKKVTAKASNTKGENTQYLPSGTDSPMYISLKSLLLRKEA